MQANRGRADTDRVFILVPAYNEAPRVRSVVTDLTSLYRNVVVIDDGSTDGTATTLEGLPLFLLRHLINRGQGAAIQTGIQFSLAQGADVIVTFDADGQHDAADISQLIDPILENHCDVTLGSRFLGYTENLPLQRKLLLKAGILFTWVTTGLRLTDVHNGLRAFSRSVAKDLNIRTDRMAHASSILERIKTGTWRYREIPVKVTYTPESLQKGQSSWNALRIAVEVLAERLR